MTLLQKLGAVLLGGLLCFGVGYLTRGKEVQTVEVPKTVVQKQTEVQTKLVDHVVTKVVTKTVKVPSGPTTTTTTTTVTEDKTKDQGRETSTDTIAIQPVGGSQQASWSLGVDWTPRLSPAAEYPTEVEIGRRILGPAWIQAGFDVYRHDVKLGVRIEW